MADVIFGPIERDGKIALARYNGIDEHIQVGEKMYDFITKGGVSFCWVDIPDVPQVLSVTKFCCGGVPRKIFQWANSAQIDYWERLNGR